MVELLLVVVVVVEVAEDEADDDEVEEAVASSSSSTPLSVFLPLRANWKRVASSLTVKANLSVSKGNSLTGNKAEAGSAVSSFEPSNCTASASVPESATTVPVLPLLLEVTRPPSRTPESTPAMSARTASNSSRSFGVNGASEVASTCATKSLIELVQPATLCKRRKSTTSSSTSVARLVAQPTTVSLEIEFGSMCSATGCGRLFWKMLMMAIGLSPYMSAIGYNVPRRSWNAVPSSVPFFEMASVCSSRSIVISTSSPTVNLAKLPRWPEW